MKKLIKHGKRTVKKKVHLDNTLILEVRIFNLLKLFIQFIVRNDENK